MDTQAKESQVIKIEYQPALFHRRVLAYVIDFILWAFFSILVFMGVRALVQSSQPFQQAETLIKETKLNSGLYLDTGTEIQEIDLYYPDQKEMTGKELRSAYENALDKFISYVNLRGGSAAGKEASADFDQYRLQSSLAYNGVSYFTADSSGKVIPNPSCQANDKEYAENVYAKYVSDHGVALLSTLLPDYLQAQKYEANMLTFMEIPVSYLAGALLVFYVPPLFFTRSRATLGKALYHIGRVNSKCLSLSFGRYTAEQAIFIFAVLGLSLVTLGLPLIISFSLMAFSKNRQDFADYLLSIREIDTENQKIYHSEDEALLETLPKENKTVDFTPDNRLDS
jgi:uncharacterized RDD family membrane protein YckC